MNTLLRISFCVMLLGSLMLFQSIASAQWADDFESYSDGQLLDGVGGWGGWDGVSAASGTASSAQARSGSLSIEIGPTTDAVHPFVGEFTSGTVEVVAWMYLPQSTFAADTYFIVNNRYDGSGVNYLWTSQVRFQVLSSTIVCEANGGGGTAPIIFDAWAEIRIVYDMDNNVQETYYDGSLISTGTVVAASGDPTEIANIDLFSTGATNFFDDLSVTPVKSCLPGDVNGDDSVDLLDVTPFVNAVTGGTFQCEADINEDGSVNLLDVTPFVDLLTGG